MDAILSHGEQPFDAAFMQATFDSYWAYAQFVVGWTNALLASPTSRSADHGLRPGLPAIGEAHCQRLQRSQGFLPLVCRTGGSGAYLTKLAA